MFLLLRVPSLEWIRLVDYGMQLGQENARDWKEKFASMFSHPGAEFLCGAQWGRVSKNSGSFLV